MFAVYRGLAKWSTPPFAVPLPLLGNRWASKLEKVARGLPHSPAQGTGNAGRLEEATPGLCRYLDLVAQWNQRVDLTAARSADELVDLTLADALVIASHPAADSDAWVDVGSGAGAPALPLALLQSTGSLTLVEPKTKRVAFLRTVVGALGLAVTVQRSRSDQLPTSSFSVALSRATLAPQAWLAEGARLATRWVWVLLARGEAPRLNGWQVVDDIRYTWPLTGVERRAVLFEAR